MKKERETLIKENLSSKKTYDIKHETLRPNLKIIGIEKT